VKPLSLICFSLKRLYVSLTKAIKNVWRIIKYQSASGILSTLSTSNISILKKPSPAVNHRPYVDQQSNISWQDPANVLVEDTCLSTWLLDTASLTERLQSMCRRFEVVVVNHQLESPSTDEIALLNCQQDNTYIREVLLLGDGVPWVFARSVIPQQINDSELDGLGCEPLGKRIFNDLRFRRGTFQLCRLDWQPMHAQLRLISDENMLSRGIATANTVYGRRSCFDFLGCKMSVAEIFLPDAPAYSNLR